MLTEEGLTHAAGIWAAYSEGNKWDLFWNVVSERHLTLEQVLASESKARYAAITNQRAARRRVLDKLLRVLGWTSSAQGGTIRVSVEQMTTCFKSPWSLSFWSLRASIHRADLTGSSSVAESITICTCCGSINMVCSHTWPRCASLI